MAQLFRILRESLLTLALVFCFTTLVLLITGAPPLKAYYHILNGSLGSWVNLSHVIKVFIPLTLCACGLVFTFRAGLWNIGIEGQVMTGAIFTTAILRGSLDAPAPLISIFLSFLAGAAGGALWALGAGYLKVKGGVHEIFSGLGLNFVAQGMALWLIFGPWKRPGVASMSGTEVFPRNLWMPYLPGYNISPLSLSVALAVFLLAVLMLGYTRIGLGLKAVGKNQKAAYLFGIKPDQLLLIALAVSGGCAGLAGSLQVSGVYHRLIPAISSNYGYLALLIVMISNYSIWGVPAVAFFFACLNVGSIQLPMVLQVDSSLSGVIQGALVMAAFALQGWRMQKKEQRI